MKKLLLVLLLSLGVMAVEAKPKYRIAVQKIEGKVYYIPQVRKKVPDMAIPQWVNLSNQPLRSKNEAFNYVRDAQIIQDQLRQAEVIQYINVK